RQKTLRPTSRRIVAVREVAPKSGDEPCPEARDTGERKATTFYREDRHQRHQDDQWRRRRPPDVSTKSFCRHPALLTGQIWCVAQETFQLGKWHPCRPPYRKLVQTTLPCRKPLGAQINAQALAAMR